MRRLEAIRYGFVTVVIVGSAAVIWECYRPGVASVCLPLVLMSGLLVALSALTIMERRFRRAVSVIGSGA